MVRQHRTTQNRIICAPTVSIVCPLCTNPAIEVGRTSVNSFAMGPPRHLGRRNSLWARQLVPKSTREKQAISRIHDPLTLENEALRVPTLGRKRGGNSARVGKKAYKGHQEFLNVDGCAYTTVTSPMGDIMIIGSPLGIHAVLMCGENSDRAEMDALAKILREGHNPVLAVARAEMSQYFAGKLQAFTFPLVPLGGTEFQQRVWLSLRDIPYGRTICYQEQAVALGFSPTACRAVGGANGKNPLAIVVPCHRVVGKSGALTGFASGVHKKEFLLNLEKGALLKLQVCQT